MNRRLFLIVAASTWTDCTHYAMNLHHDIQTNHYAMQAHLQLGIQVGVVSMHLIQPAFAPMSCPEPLGILHKFILPQMQSKPRANSMEEMQHQKASGN